MTRLTGVILRELDLARYDFHCAYLHSEQVTLAGTGSGVLMSSKRFKGSLHNYFVSANIRPLLSTTTKTHGSIRTENIYRSESWYGINSVFNG